MTHTAFTLIYTIFVVAFLVAGWVGGNHFLWKKGKHWQYRITIVTVGAFAILFIAMNDNIEELVGVQECYRNQHVIMTMQANDDFMHREEFGVKRDICRYLEEDGWSEWRFTIR